MCFLRLEISFPSTIKTYVSQKKGTLCFIVLKSIFLENENYRKLTFIFLSHSQFLCVCICALCIYLTHILGDNMIF